MGWENNIASITTKEGEVIAYDAKKYRNENAFIIEILDKYVYDSTLENYAKEAFDLERKKRCLELEDYDDYELIEELEDRDFPLLINLDAVSNSELDYTDKTNLMNIIKTYYQSSWEDRAAINKAVAEILKL